MKINPINYYIICADIISNARERLYRNPIIVTSRHKINLKYIVRNSRTRALAERGLLTVRCAGVTIASPSASAQFRKVMVVAALWWEQQSGRARTLSVTITIIRIALFNILGSLPRSSFMTHDVLYSTHTRSLSRILGKDTRRKAKQCSQNTTKPAKVTVPRLRPPSVHFTV